VHLFVWNREKSELVGAYRLGRSDEILARWGKRGLYTSTLFRYPASLVRGLGPAIELGRSFVRPEYQRSFSPLMLLWRGIGQFIANSPRYRFLFGPVSISDDYHPVSRQLIVAFLQANHLLPELAARVKPRRPLRLRTIAGVNPRRCAGGCVDLDELGELVQEIEKGQKGIPILLRQYLKLGGQLLGFNVDPDFGHVVDGLILIDLLRTDPRVLIKYMGRKNVESVLAFHGVRLETPPRARDAGAPGA
jgi:putative hemolysin